MSKPEWGTKRLCQSCGTKFYDLHRTPVTCPSCGVAVDRESPLKSRRVRSATAAPKPVPKEPVKKPQPVEVEEDGEKAEKLDDADLADKELADADLGDDIADDSDDALIEDTSELGDDDVSDVVASKEEDEER